MHIETRKLDGEFFEEMVGETLVRCFARTEAGGYVAAVSLTPGWVDYSSILNLDLVMTEYPSFLAGRFEFEYGDPNRRLARRAGRGLGKFAHLHLSATRKQINLILKNFGKEIWLNGDEVAIQCGEKCLFWQTSMAVEMLEVAHENPLHQIVRDAERAARWSGETACHSIAVQSISDGVEIAAGSGMAGHFSAAAAGVAGYGGSIARESMKKVREAGQASWKNSDGGKNKEAADRLDMQNRVENLRNQQKNRG